MSRTLDILADAVLTETTPLHRRKSEHIITELVHQCDVVRSLIVEGVSTATDFD